MSAPQLTARERKIVNRAIQLIEEEPRRMSMETYGATDLALKEDGSSPIPSFVSSKQLPPCGTVACLAGWISYAALPKRHSQDEVREALEDAQYIAAKILHLGYDYDRVFWVSAWPEKFREAFLKVGKWGPFGVKVDKIQPKKVAKIAIERLRYYLKTGD